MTMMMVMVTMNAFFCPLLTIDMHCCNLIHQNVTIFTNLWLQFCISVQQVSHFLVMGEWKKRVFEHSMLSLIIAQLAEIQLSNLTCLRSHPFSCYKWIGLSSLFLFLNMAYWHILFDGNARHGCLSFAFPPPAPWQRSSSAISRAHGHPLHLTSYFVYTSVSYCSWPASLTLNFHNWSEMFCILREKIVFKCH